MLPSSVYFDGEQCRSDQRRAGLGLHYLPRPLCATLDMNGLTVNLLIVLLPDTGIHVLTFKAPIITVADNILNSFFFFFFFFFFFEYFLRQ